MRWCKQKKFYPKFLRQILYVYAHFRVHYIYESKPETCTVYEWQKEVLKSLKKKRLIIFNSSINKLYLQLKRKNSLTEHENMWKTKKKKAIWNVKFIRCTVCKFLKTPNNLNKFLKCNSILWFSKRLAWERELLESIFN